MDVELRPRTSAGETDRTDEREPRSRPVVVWATFGMLCIAFNAYLFARWFASGNMKPVPKGDTPVPTSVRVIVHSWEALLCAASLYLLYRFVIRPWRRDRRLGLDGLLLLAFMTLTWQDLLMNFTQVAFLYNAEFINRGSWYNFIPGWVSPNGQSVPEPLLGIFTLYGPFFLLAALFGCWVMRKSREKFPRMRSVGLVGMATLFFLVGLPTFEFFALRYGQMWAYPGAARHGPLRWLTLFPGTYYQYPLYCAGALGAMLLGSFAAIRYFRNDRGETLAERGIEEVNVQGRGQTWVRFLALSGMVNMAYLVVFFLPWHLFALNADTWPRSLTEKSYMRGGNGCGPGTAYACPGPRTPIPRPDSIPLGPDAK